MSSRAQVPVEKSSMIAAVYGLLFAVASTLLASAIEAAEIDVADICGFGPRASPKNCRSSDFSDERIGAVRSYSVVRERSGRALRVLSSDPRASSLLILRMRTDSIYSANLDGRRLAPPRKS